MFNRLYAANAMSAALALAVPPQAPARLHTAGHQHTAGYGTIVGYTPQGMPLYRAAGMPQYTAGYQEIVGVDAPGGAGPAPVAAAAANTVAYGQTMAVQEAPATKARVLPLGLTALQVPASGGFDVTSRPQILFRPKKLSIPATFAVNFVITDIRLGNKTQFIQAQQISAECFTPDAVDSAFTFDTCQPSNDLTVSVLNLDAAHPQDFRGMMLGLAADY